MKIVTFLLITVFVAALGAAGWFYSMVYQPMAEDYTRMKPEIDKTKAELKKFKEKEAREAAWMNPLIDALSSGLSDEIKAEKAEVLIAGHKVVVNISEQALFMTGSYTFSKESPQLLLKMAGLLRNENIKGKEVHIGNTTQAATAQGQGRRKMPTKDARKLSADRSEALVKYFEKNEVEQDLLVAGAYSSKKPEIGFKIKDHKTVIIIENPPVVPMVATKADAAPAAPQAAAKTAPASTGTATVSAAPSATPPAQPKTIPIQPARPKTQ